MISSSQRPLPDNTQHSQQTYLHAPGGIWTHDLSRRAAADLRLRPRGHWDRHIYIYINTHTYIYIWRERERERERENVSNTLGKKCRRMFPTTKQKTKLYKCISLNSFRGTDKQSVDFSSLDFYLRWHSKTVLRWSPNENEDTPHQRTCHACQTIHNHLATFQYRTWPSVQWFKWRHFGVIFVNCNLIHNEDSTVINP